MSPDPYESGDSVVACNCHRGPWRWPKNHRRSFPTHWLTVYSWRQIQVFTPKVLLRSALVTVHVLPRNGLLLGLWVGRDDDDEWEIRLGLGLFDVEAHVMEWLR